MKKYLAVLTVVMLLLSVTPAFARSQDGVTELYGVDREDTAGNIAYAGWFTANQMSTSNIIIASGWNNLMDILLVTPLAESLNAPILTCGQNAYSDIETAGGYDLLGVKKAYILGSFPNVKQNAFADQILTKEGITTSPIPGTNSDPISTAVAIASQLKNIAGSFVIGYNALPDALSVASYAAAHSYDILIANPDGTLPANEQPYLKAPTYIIGGPTMVADIHGATRIYGADRFATNEAVLKTLNYSGNQAVFIANGTDDHLVDALVAAPFAAKTDSPIVLVDAGKHNGSNVLADIKSQLTFDTQVYILSGPTVIPPSIGDAFNTAMPDLTVKNLTVTGQTSGTGKVGDPATAPVGTPITIEGTVQGWGPHIEDCGLTFYIQDGYQKVYQAGISPTGLAPIGPNQPFTTLVPIVAKNNDYTYSVSIDSDGYTSNNSGQASISFVSNKPAGPLTVQVTPWDAENSTPITVQLEWK